MILHQHTGNLCDFKGNEKKWLKIAEFISQNYKRIFRGGYPRTPLMCTVCYPRIRSVISPRKMLAALDLRSKLEYTQKGLRTYFTVLYWNSHVSLTGRAEGLRHSKHDGSCWGRCGQMFSVPASDSFRLFRLNSFLYVSQMIYDGQ